MYVPHESPCMKFKSLLSSVSWGHVKSVCSWDRANFSDLKDSFKRMLYFLLLPVSSLLTRLEVTLSRNGRSIGMCCDHSR